MLRKAIFFFTFFSAGLFAVGPLLAPIHAQIQSLQQLNIDTTLVQPDAAFSIPTSIVVLPIFAPTSDFIVQDRDWYRGLFYYLVANERRPGFTDIPFHYVVSGDGRVFKGNSGGEERKINIEGVGDDQVVIGYLANRSERSFDPRSQSVLGELIVDIASRNNIKLDKVSVSTVDYVRDDGTQTVSLKKQDLFGVWNSTLKDIVNDSKFLYSPVKKQYTVEVVAVNLPSEQVTPGEVVSGSLTLKNTSDYGIYGGTVSELIGSKKSGSSIFYSGANWVSSSQFPLMDDSSLLLPNEEKSFEFKLYVPLFFGEKSEAFRIKNVDGSNIAGSDFTIKLNIKKPKGTIVEVKPTETGWLRVRSSPSGAATEVDRISVGNRYFQVEDAGNGWVRLDLGGGKSGWVSSVYLNYL